MARRKELTQVRFYLRYKEVESVLFSLNLCFLNFSTLFLIWTGREGEKIKTIDLEIMEYLGGYCIKKQPAKMGLEDLRRRSLTQPCARQGRGSPQARELLNCSGVSLPPLGKHTWRHVSAVPSRPRLETRGQRDENYLLNWGSPGIPHV